MFHRPSLEPGRGSVRHLDRAALGSLILAVLVGACGFDSPRVTDVNTTLELGCDLPQELLADGGPPPDGIPALTGPRFVTPESPEADYLVDGSRVVGMVVDGQPRAYPHNIFWWHEIVNDEVDGRPVTVTFCPLTGSALAIDPRIQGRTIEFGVSGLLFANNLVMFDREARQVYGPQMSVEGRCNTFRGSVPTLLPVMETSWKRWRELHPGTVVLSEDTGFSRNYTESGYPYGSYDLITDESLFVPMPVDDSRPLKERVLGIRVGRDGGKAYPFLRLEALGEVLAVNDEVDGRPVVVFYEARDGGTAVAFDRRVGGTVLTFEVAGQEFRDLETGTRWDLAGRAVEGPLAGETLTPDERAYVAFWFAWKHFQPDSEILEAPPPS